MKMSNFQNVRIFESNEETVKNVIEKGEDCMGEQKDRKIQKRTCEEKMALILEYYNSGIGYQVFAEAKGISPSLFYIWIKKYEEGGIEGLRHKRKRQPQMDSMSREIQKLKLIIAEQQIEIQQLKEEYRKKHFE